MTATPQTLEHRVLRAVIEADAPCSMLDVVMAFPDVKDGAVQRTVRSLLNRGLFRLTLDWRIVADTEPDLQWSAFEHRDNPISDLADELRMALSHHDIEDAFTALKRVYDEMRGVTLDAGAVHDGEDDAA